MATGQGLICLALAPLIGIPLTPGSVLAATGVIALTAFALTSLGFVLAWRMETTQGFHALMNLFLIPLWLLSGALFPASGASTWLQWVMRINPVAYAVDLLRVALYPGEATAMGLAPWPVGLAVTVAFGAVTFVAGARMVRRPGWSWT